MKEMITAVACGRANGMLVVDLTKEEEDAEDAVDIPMAISSRTKNFSLLQMDGDLSIEELEKILELGEKACAKAYEMQRNALLKKYEKEREGVEAI
jgi:exosome complex component RRP41